jgi:hypothetical protein
MENKGLLFIPDISGFTRFVNETEIEHSKIIIQELLELLINANEVGLEISEIEGDAILFYKFGLCPDLEKLYSQVKKMFCEFHRSLKGYDYRRYCQCKACTSAINLTLKVVSHYGEFSGYNVKNFSKLIGKDVIVAHQLLKNDIDQHEYWLVTDNLLTNCNSARLIEGMTWESDSKQTESGAIGFQFTRLGELKNDIEPEAMLQVQLSDKAKMITQTKEYETDIIRLFHATGDFNYRAKWQEGVKAVEELNHFLPRVGMRCKCLLDNGQVRIYSTSYSYSADKIEFSETNEGDNNVTYYTLEKTGPNQTKLTIDIYTSNNVFTQTVFRLMEKKRVETLLKKSLENLTTVVQQIKL